MSFLDGGRVLVPLALFALFTAGCGSFLNPHPPPDPENMSLTERRALSKGAMADPDPPTRSMWNLPAERPAPARTSDPLAAAPPKR